MTDIVERLRTFLGNGIGEDAAKEIEALRQRVQELEAIVVGCNKQRDKTEAELAALKQSQGEPVAWMQSDHLSKLVHKACGSQSMLARCSDHKLQSDFKPLYTAPTIPEGWQIVPIEPTPAMIEEGYAQAWIRNPSNFGDKDAIFVYKAMLAAAPKPEDVK